jgi:uncharacterized membrane protein (UPF0127 family)
MKSQFPVKVVRTPDELHKGLGGQNPIKKPMLFVFPEEGMHSMCMRDMLVNIDIVWIRADGTIVKVYNDADYHDQEKLYPSEVPVKYAIECAAGGASRLGLREGEHLEFVF